MLDRMQGALLGVKMGDVLGLALETYSAERIRALFGEQGVTGFLDPKKFRSDNSGFVMFDHSDDWQLTRAVVRSIIDRRGWNQAGCALEHLREFKHSSAGWGKTTTQAMLDLQRGLRADITCPPDELGLNLGCGNGPLMKVAGLAVWAAITKSERELAQWCMEMSFITHPDPRAGFAAYAGAFVIARIMQESVRNEDGAEVLLGELIEHITHFEEYYRQFRWNSDRLSERLKKIRVGDGSDQDMAQLFGVGSHSLSSAPFTIALFLRHPRDFRGGVLAAVKAGGDTDTHAAIVGAMIGANVGLEGIPFEWRQAHPSFREPIDLGVRLWQAAHDLNNK